MGPVEPHDARTGPGARREVPIAEEADGSTGWFLPALGWIAFPLVPVILGTAYCRTLDPTRTDPRGWDRDQWVLMAGPLIGYGFLVGAPADLPERGVEGRGRLRRWLGRRWVAVGVGPWAGFLGWVATYYADVWLGRLFGTEPSSLIGGPDWLGTVLIYGLILPTLAYPWLFPAIVWLGRARRTGRLAKSLRAGLLTAAAFVGSLFGGFWAATAIWRSYFFDPTIVPLALIAVLLIGSAGCSTTTTLGEVRRRELFDAMLAAWLIGLALIWQWRSRPRRA